MIEGNRCVLVEDSNKLICNIEALDKCESRAKIPGNSRESALCILRQGRRSGFMSTKPSSHPQDVKPPCKHPRVQIVSRDEDAEFVECLECREVFESSELKDMSIEERTEREAKE